MLQSSGSADGAPASSHLCFHGQNQDVHRGMRKVWHKGLRVLSLAYADGVTPHDCQYMLQQFTNESELTVICSMKAASSGSVFILQLVFLSVILSE